MKTTANLTRGRAHTPPWKTLAAGAAACLLLAGAQTARAGQKEWATAGKILTGVVIADVLFNHLPAARQETRVVETHVVTYAPPPVQVIEYRTVYAPPPPPVQVVHYRTVYAPPAPVCAPLVVVPPPRPVIVQHPGWYHGRGNPHVSYRYSGCR